MLEIYAMTAQNTHALLFERKKRELCAEKTRATIVNNNNINDVRDKLAKSF